MSNNNNNNNNDDDDDDSTCPTTCLRLSMGETLYSCIYMQEEDDLCAPEVPLRINTHTQFLGRQTRAKLNSGSTNNINVNNIRPTN